ncbi:P-loop containing nucleoside triphosphate hydrolase protein [Dunaliella salina]|uniref:P-loop containing nucleoside triphosphate hydrolase protein n=1 Tax=Dunaliella salina TaxID=3046 RepID=A0ABQ7FU30_DUNSA|nr:P-loop containing nucleoside triphosphate hydrolase protein [Dunaliella salina]|eukprot:KAF5825865.1 P-loop containing nucleoside triphosphate hydrolase protein [Dunaliella salina]
MVDEGEEGQQQMAALQAQAAAKGSDFENRKRARLTEEFQSTDKDNSRKAYFKEFRKVVELADVVIQVLDARDPLGCRCPDVESYVRSISPNKKIILLLNKMDLVPREAGEKWLKYFREELPCVAFKCSTQQQGAGLKQGRMLSTKSLQEGLTGSGCLGADTLLAMLKNYCRNADIKTAITVGIVGLPNVGKSSLINSLKRSRAAQVHHEMSSLVLKIITHIFKHSRSTMRFAPVAEIVKRVPSKQLVALYKIPAFKTADELLAAVAGARGKLRKGGVPDIRAASRIILQVQVPSAMPYFCTPFCLSCNSLLLSASTGSWRVPIYLVHNILSVSINL